ncbi:branched-chain amino acid aminotransferase II [Russula vinacea]|nr:branched-chain amino acid aminotransferase II [Russula vinacea]
MASALYRLQTCLWRARSQSLFPTVVSARWMSNSQSPLSDIEAKIYKTSTPKKLPALKSLKFGHNFTDHMLVIPWNSSQGWGTPEIKPYGPLSLEPSSTVFHYAQCIFEGLKAYRNKNGKRLALPTFNGAAFLDVIKELVRLERHWIPQENGHSLYIRPVMIGTQNTIGISPPDSALLFVICSPVGPYYPEGFKPVALHGTTEYVRAYLEQAADSGYVQNLWLSGPEHNLTEVGTMNLFVVFRQQDGTLELVTPPLDGMILPGVTRDSVLSLARSHAAGTLQIPNLTSKIAVSERGVTMKEVCVAAQSGRLVEMFGAGTAAIVSPIDKIGYEGKDIEIPVQEDGMGPVSRPIWADLVARQTGEVESDWSVVVYEE